MKQRVAALKYGWRSGFEAAIGVQLSEAQVPFEYEPFKISYEIHKQCKYTPDFVLENGIIIETKGRFVVQDRMKHRYIKEQHPDLDIRFVFYNANSRITKTSKTSYSMWCDKYGFKWANKSIPQEWMDE